ncbi:hypothetical protein [Variovorax paradoxus]|uniref:hypothetical protein n=1 Tax=Variovorax paradoxus TaxID=34073 RepID=UPI0028646B98|nr:hypothetical protein [Variovorax paradoxus]MDR6455477.1 hypothetical protein [Variovorax paradoxus]
MSNASKPGTPDATPTPRTDAEHYTVETAANYGMGDEYAHHVVDVDFARTLEREVALLTKERDGLAQALFDLDCMNWLDADPCDVDELADYKANARRLLDALRASGHRFSA